MAHVCQEIASAFGWDMEEKKKVGYGGGGGRKTCRLRLGCEQRELHKRGFRHHMAIARSAQDTVTLIAPHPSQGCFRQLWKSAECVIMPRASIHNVLLSRDKGSESTLDGGAKSCSLGFFFLSPFLSQVFLIIKQLYWHQVPIIKAKGTPQRD